MFQIKLTLFQVQEFHPIFFKKLEISRRFQRKSLLRYKYYRLARHVGHSETNSLTYDTLVFHHSRPFMNVYETFSSSNFYNSVCQPTLNLFSQHNQIQSLTHPLFIIRCRKIHF